MMDNGQSLIRKAHLSLGSGELKNPSNSTSRPTDISGQQEAPKVLHNGWEYNVLCCTSILFLKNVFCTRVCSYFYSWNIRKLYIVVSVWQAFHTLTHCDHLLCIFFFVTPRVLSHNFDISRVSMNSSFLVIIRLF